MALTGLGLIGFLIAHLAGNLFIYSPGGVAFNHYAEMLENNPLLVPAEIALLAIFLFHIYLAITVTRENFTARPTPYQQKTTAGESTLASRTMMISGLIILVFVVLHVYMFKYGEKRGPNNELALWELVIKSFQNPLIVAWYVAAMIVLGMHLSHGFSSLFQSLGWVKQGWRHPMRRAGAVIGWVLALAFAAMPIYAIAVNPKPKSPPNVLNMVQEQIGASEKSGQKK
jgi:succinate dehydrogenase / fumarate reductase cytochrome b subunit